MKYSIIVTVFNREELVLMNTFAALAKMNPQDTEIIVVDDGSTVDYTAMAEMFVDDWKLPIKWCRRDTVSDRPESFHLNGHNNPAYVNNEAIALARGENIVFLSSDCIVPPHAMSRLDRWDLDKMAVTAQVVEMDTGQMFCGAERPFFACWWLAASADLIRRIGGFDEEYIKGMAFEDNDFTGRLALTTGKMVIDSNVTVFHQSHAPRIPSGDDTTEAARGYIISKDYTRKKWGGVPFDSREDVISCSQSNVNTVTIVRCKPNPSCLWKPSEIIDVK